MAPPLLANRSTGPASSAAISRCGSPADVAAGRAAVGVVDRVDLPVGVGRSARALDGGDELGPGLVRGDRAVLGGAVVVLYLLDREDVGRLEIVDDDLREPANLVCGSVGARSPR
jgi:hypothetical protein